METMERKPLRARRSFVPIQAEVRLDPRRQERPCRGPGSLTYRNGSEDGVKRPRSRRSSCWSAASVFMGAVLGHTQPLHMHICGVART